MRRILRSYELSLEILMDIIKPILATLLLLLCAFLIKSGFEYIVLFHGIHPGIAIPGAILSATAALIVLFTEYQEEEI